MTFFECSKEEFGEKPLNIFWGGAIDSGDLEVEAEELVHTKA